MKTFDATWENVHQEMEWGKYPSEEVIRFVARNYYQQKRADVQILDLGCGTGAVSWYLAREGFMVYGIDGSRTAIEKAKHRIVKEKLKAEFQVGDLSELNYKNQSMNAVIDSAAICANSVNGIQAILKECYRVLKPEGKLFSTGLFKVGMTDYGTGEKVEENTYREITEGSVAHIGTIHFFERQEILDLWSEAGFKNMQLDSLHRTDLGSKNEVSYFMVESQKI